MARDAVLLTECPQCGVVLSDHDLKHYMACPQCEYQIRVELTRFGGREWEAEQSPAWLVGCLAGLGIPMGGRKTRLICAAVGRRAPASFAGAAFLRAVTAAEEWADDGYPQTDVIKLRRDLGRGPDWAWRPIGLACLAPDPPLLLGSYRANTRQHFADAYRELFANPFLPLAWKPEWFTSTVCDLAAHIYDARDFAAMPILADALQDAGCDDEQVLSHCRANKPHARGCWVVDAILGKT
jgi:hypothetical protein